MSFRQSCFNSKPTVDLHIHVKNQRSFYAGQESARSALFRIEIG